MTPRRGAGESVEPVQPALGEVLDFMREIWALDHAVQQTSKRMERELGITGLQRLVIRVVGRFPSIPAGRLAELLHVHPSTLTGVLARLERQGAITRRPDPHDGRRSLLGLTGKGRMLDVEREGTIEAAVQRVLERTDAHTIAAARSMLREIVHALGGRLAAGSAAQGAATRGRSPR